ncbi:hypothetical protein OUZ56_012659 [Daphnia magna]|uniref:Uncharacterized protein n=1 Tax=Daphnia magna TaxID=35525 RepID=A0ABQ9Z3P1_9CRUS|nr:hypothetical protein OUZ56_012659 [Daphnia magna]
MQCATRLIRVQIQMHPLLVVHIPLLSKGISNWNVDGKQAVNSPERGYRWLVHRDLLHKISISSMALVNVIWAINLTFIFEKLMGNTCSCLSRNATPIPASFRMIIIHKKLLEWLHPGSIVLGLPLSFLCTLLWHDSLNKKCFLPSPRRKNSYRLNPGRTSMNSSKRIFWESNFIDLMSDISSQTKDYLLKSRLNVSNERLIDESASSLNPNEHCMELKYLLVLPNHDLLKLFLIVLFRLLAFFSELQKNF